PTHRHAAAGPDPQGRRQDADEGVLFCELILSGVFERHPRLTLAIVEFELAWAPHLLSTMDYTYRERHGEADLPVPALAEEPDSLSETHQRWLKTLFDQCLTDQFPTHPNREFFAALQGINWAIR
ncbi:MAG: hypothetical protein WBX30_09560, partial [Stellaceae bacterium]